MKVDKRTKAEPEVRILKSLKDIDKQIADLEKSFVKGKMEEATYKDIKQDLEKRKARLETITDLLNV